MEIAISKTEFEKAVLVATSSHTAVYDMVSQHFSEQADTISYRYVGDEIMNDTDKFAVISPFFKNMVAVSAFLDVFRSLDLVLTPTGFGVVNNDQTVPASKQRVDELEGELRRGLMHIEYELVRHLSMMNGWSETAQAKANIMCIFWNYTLYEYYIGKDKVTPAEWRSAAYDIATAEQFITNHIGYETYNYILDEIRKGSEPADYVAVVRYIRLYVASCILKNESSKGAWFRSLIQTLDSDSTKYALYFNSDAYKLNHFTRYENTKESGTFFF